MPVDILRPSTWVRYKPSLCRNCRAGCCTLPVRVSAEDLYHMGLIRFEEVNAPLKPLADRLIKKGILRSFNQRTQLGLLQRHKNQDCIFLDENRRCKIYERRPTVCRRFPKDVVRPGFCPNQKKTLVTLLVGLVTLFANPLFAADTSAMDEKIGQMLVVGFRGYSIDETHTVAKDLSERHVGGVVLFDRDMTLQSPRNVENPTQLKRLIEQVRKFSARPIIGIDHEGGFVCRLKEKFGFPKTLTALKLAALPEDEFSQTVQGMADVLHGLGINFNFAPVVDVNVSPQSPAIGKYERSFSSDPELVIERALGFIEAHRRRGILTSLKHFPGHGSSKADSHMGLTDVTETWKEIELRPFEELIRRKKADAVMTAHVFHRKLDPKYPATLSPLIIKRYLRERMGFDGVVISDDMQMGAITQHYGLETAVRLALEADVDMLCFGNNVSFDEHIAEKVIAVIKKLVQEGTIAEDRIERSYRRIQRLKEQGI